jgi:hypothetical protein
MEVHMSVPVSIRIVLICAQVAPGALDFIKRAMPATSGVAIEVPDRVS